MSNLKETCLSSEHIYKGKFLDVWKDKVELPNGKTSSREYIKHPGAVVIIPVLPDGKIGLIRQYRYPMGMEQIELPAGKLDKNEDHLDTAKRELEEEIGYRANSMKEITEIHPCIGYSDERMWIYLAEELTHTKTNQDLDEFVELMPTELIDSVEMIWSGKITDVKSIIGILWANRLLN
jgi:ADP-ribose pyrophosphatase